MIFFIKASDEEAASSSSSAAFKKESEAQKPRVSDPKHASTKVYLVDDKVQFQICTCIKTKQQYAVNIKLLEPRKETGFITMIKDNYGFIELNRASQQNRHTTKKSGDAKESAVPRDMFFHFSSVQSGTLDVGDEVEFKINRKNKQKLCAENVCKLSPGTIKPVTITNTRYIFKVLKVLKKKTQQKIWFFGVFCDS